MTVPSIKKETYTRFTKIWKRKEQEEEQVNKEHTSEITRLAIVQEGQGKQENEHVSRTILWDSATDQDHNEEKVKKEQVPKITRFLVTQERKEEQVNKEQVQDIVLSRIIERDQSTGRKGEFKFQRDDESTNEEEYDSASEKVLFWSIWLGGS